MQQIPQKKFHAVLFDLDGTLLDSLEDLANATNAALRSKNYPNHPVPAYRHFVGNGLEKLVRRALPEGEAERIGQSGVDELMRLTEKVYLRDLTAKTRPYPGILELVESLRQRGIPAGVVTNKPHVWTERLLRYYFPDANFVSIQGAAQGIPKKPDPASALASASRMGLPPEKIAFLGDSDVDMFTARNAGMGAIGASWGFRGEAELRAAGAMTILNTPQELLDWME